MNAALSDGKIPSLDGLRAFSIMLVVVGHLHATRGFPELGLEHILGDYGLLGVRVFFVISGFLITTLLLRELEQQGRISLRAFYARRALRIFPAAFVFIGALALADWLGWIELRPVVDPAPASPLALTATAGIGLPSELEVTVPRITPTAPLPAG